MPTLPKVRDSAFVLVSGKTLNQHIDTLNALQNMQVRFTKTGKSGIIQDGKSHLLTISTKDINAGVVSGSTSGNTALQSLLSLLHDAGVVNNQSS
jgi:hypothetical protein